MTTAELEDMRQTDAYGPVPGIPHTIEEVKADIAEFEREWDEGTLVTYTTEEVMDEMRALIKFS